MATVGNNVQISFGFDTPFARQKHNLVSGYNRKAKAAPGAVGFQPPEKFSACKPNNICTNRYSQLK